MYLLIASRFSAKMRKCRSWCKAWRRRARGRWRRRAPPSSRSSISHPTTTSACSSRTKPRDFSGTCQMFSPRKCRSQPVSACFATISLVLSRGTGGVAPAPQCFHCVLFAFARFCPAQDGIKLLPARTVNHRVSRNGIKECESYGRRCIRGASLWDGSITNVLYRLAPFKSTVKWNKQQRFNVIF